MNDAPPAEAAGAAAEAGPLTPEGVPKDGQPARPLAVDEEPAGTSETERPALPTERPAPATSIDKNTPKRKRTLSARTRAKISRARKGRKLSAQTRAKMSRAKKGRKLSAEHRAKLSKAHQGHPVSAQTRAKISRAKKGRKLSAEHRAKLSKAHQGRPLSRETREKFSRARKGRRMSAKTRAKISKTMQGHPVSSEARQKMSRRKSESQWGARSPRYWHGAYATPDHPVDTVEDVIADLSAKQARLSALLDEYLAAGEGFSHDVVTLFSLHSTNAGKLAQLLRSQKRDSQPSESDVLKKAMEQALDELSKEWGLAELVGSPLPPPAPV